ncbi:MAG: sigma-70 family RNA polymerase sigma factor [Aeromicrobium sp.]
MIAPTGLPEPTDAELVAGVLAADRDAFALVYDRYGPRLYDFAYSMLRHTEDAQDAVADSFVIVAERLNQLRDPDRLRPWLYAIVRSQCLRKLKARKRISFGDDEQLMQMPDNDMTPDQAAEQSAMQKIVWDAAAGLADRDRAILDLHLRQGLEGAELGEAMGVTAANAYVMLNRLRAQVDRSLGALLIARMGRDDCEELDELLADWDGTFSPLIRKRVARHVDDCKVCSRRRKKFVSPWMLLASVPLFAAPLSLRDRVVLDTDLVAYTTPNGESLASAPSSGGWRRPKAAMAVAAAVVAITSATVLLWPGNDPKESAEVTASATPIVPSEEPEGKVTKPSAPPAKPGSVMVSTSSIDLGRNSNNSSVTLTNPGGLTVGYQVASGSDWLSASPAGGSIDPGKSARVDISAARSKVGEGKSTSNIVVTWKGGRATVKVSLEEERAPIVGRPSAGPNPSCNVPVSVSVSDESGLNSVILRWTGPSGSGSKAMSHSGSRWAAQMGPISVGGSVTIRVTATDVRGNSATGPSRTFAVDPCPQ